ncbi:hypothetical protein HJG60_008094 [Phyllostomus discolor]|uniref:Uncharacterized protein n=1 Tax=Phyllostomus discolor TaxID=89673 RepID=A0A834BLN1_9CHIR|nr:hypothetical protein HJG60_008094 [Phyllostomus discolor]
MEWGSHQSSATSQVGTLGPRGGWAPVGPFPHPSAHQPVLAGTFSKCPPPLGHRRVPARAVGEGVGSLDLCRKPPSCPAHGWSPKTPQGAPGPSGHPTCLSRECQTVSRPEVKVSMESPGHRALPPAHRCLGA